ncbi:cas scaffolding protein family member 4 isoform X2 [Coregonus clupeaformis]|uniref:cas scaffolding protein family member 4 isoform X2 n=1 Tax=Coregonus clupeaformis TaxID=59861 RepID=UPI001E1C568D|nr:cas scaffolding protein family member 4 isoform X2 [Coregonus clupeaformis]
METLLARALYDNIAECSDELGFRKGDVVTVLQQEVDGNCGWWICFLSGRQGLAPANRLQLLPLAPPQTPAQTQGKVTDLGAGSVDPGTSHNSDSDRPGNLYQIPSIPRHTHSSSPAYECMDRVYKVPSIPGPGPARHSPASPQKHHPDGPEGNHHTIKASVSSVFSGCSKGEVYDVPGIVRRASLFPASTTPQHLTQTASSMATYELERQFDTLGSRGRCSPSPSPSLDNVYVVPPPVVPDPSYDIPIPFSGPPASDTQQRLVAGGYNPLTSPQRQHGSYSTLPKPSKSNWIYDVPSSPEKPGGESGYYTHLPSGGQPGNYTTLPSKDLSSASQLYDTLTRNWSVQGCGSAQSFYDIPKPRSSPQGSQDPPIPPRVLPRAPLYNRPPGQRQTDEERCVYAVPPREQLSVSVPQRGHHVPLECRGNSGPTYDHPNPQGRLQRGRLGLVAGRGDTLLQEEDEERGRRSTSDKQRISTASTSSTSSSSSDSLVLCSSSPEPQREVCLSQEEACRRLHLLQQEVCREVPRLMEFVSSRWRSRDHLGKHLTEIRSAAEGVAGSVTSFLTFALDVKGNARRLTDSNLQARLQRQLSVLEDSGIILQQAVSSLGVAGWPLSLLAQDPAQNHTPDQLDRLVRVTRTVPEDVKRLVSIVNANAKLLFRPTEKREADGPSTSNNTSTSTSQFVKKRTEQGEDSGTDHHDSVQEDQKRHVSEPQVCVDGPRRSSEPLSPRKPSMSDSGDAPRRTSEPQGSLSARRPSQSEPHVSDTPSPAKSFNSQVDSPKRQPTVSEHCRLYFGALQKAIGVLITSLLDSQPPEKFISHSKLVIMVGKRLVDTLCREAQRGEPGSVSESGLGPSQSQSQVLLCKANHLCALLKQLAIATKKAALHYPERPPLQEAQDFAKELAQRAQHFRISLDL